MIEVIKLLIPVLTFLLGIVVTLNLERYKQKKGILYSNIDNICDLINDWYNQLYDLKIQNNLMADSNKFKRDMFFYSQNRLVLPKILQSIEILKRYKIAKTLIEHVESFLRNVTDYEENIADKEVYTCKKIKTKILDVLKENTILNEIAPENESIPFNLDSDLEVLDSTLQKINIEAGRIKK